MISENVKKIYKKLKKKLKLFTICFMYRQKNLNVIVFNIYIYIYKNKPSKLINHNNQTFPDFLEKKYSHSV